jgi:hypothetical protein
MNITRNACMLALPYRQREVRDLAWACFSPPLLHSDQLGIAGVDDAAFPFSAQRRHWLARLDADPEPLRDFLNVASPQRLGLYFERLWQFFLSRDPEVELVAHNLPVREGGRTIGEFDCLYYCRRRQRHCHLELAVKYYLAHGDTAAPPGAWDIWLGPDSNDRLDRKLQRLLSHQTRLAEHPAGQAALAALGVNAPLRELGIKGCLFHHPARAVAPPRGFNQQHALQHWRRVSELTRTLAESQRYQVLPRLQWLSPAVCEAEAGSLDHDTLLSTLRSHFRRHRSPQLVATLDSAGREQNRFFVTDEYWPAKPRP